LTHYCELLSSFVYFCLEECRKFPHSHMGQQCHRCRAPFLANIGHKLSNHFFKWSKFSIFLQQFPMCILFHPSVLDLCHPIKFLVSICSQHFHWLRIAQCWYPIPHRMFGNSLPPIECHKSTEENKQWI